MLVGQIKKQLEEERPDDFEEMYVFHGSLVGYVKKERFVDLCRYLRDDGNLKFNFLSMITAADYLDKRQKRFEVVYSLFSIVYYHRIMLKVSVDEDEEVPSLTVFWDTANCQEREVFDMFGIKFTGHPDLSRILMDDDWVGYPQRKDFPLTYETPEFSHNRDRIDLNYRSPGKEVF